MRIPAAGASRALRDLARGAADAVDTTAAEFAAASGTKLSLAHSLPPIADGSALPSLLPAKRRLVESSLPSGREMATKPSRIMRNTAQDLTGLLGTAKYMADWESAATAFARAAKVDATFRPNDVQLQLLVDACAKCDALPQVEAPLMEFIAARGTSASDDASRTETTVAAEVQHNDGAATTLMHAYGQAHQWAAALRILTDMQATAAATGTPQPSVSAYNEAFRACEHSRRWADALRLHSAMLDAGRQPDAVSYASIMVTLEQTQHHEAAKQLLDAMPAREAADVMASYAALIHTWSARHAHKAMKRF